MSWQERYGSSAEEPLIKPNDFFDWRGLGMYMDEYHPASRYSRRDMPTNSSGLLELANLHHHMGTLHQMRSEGKLPEAPTDYGIPGMGNMVIKNDRPNPLHKMAADDHFKAAEVYRDTGEHLKKFPWSDNNLEPLYFWGARALSSSSYLNSERG